MHDQPKYIPLRSSDFFGDGRSARVPVDGTVARGHLNDDAHFYSGKVDGKLVETLPFPATRVVLERGQERYNIYCAPCHSRVGDGNGVIVQRGYRRPESFHAERLRKMPVGHYFDAMTRGFGAMPDFASQISPKDRWTIAAYIRALQLSQHATLEDVPESERGSMGAAAPVASAETEKK
jgi:cytochrome c553